MFNRTRLLTFTIFVGFAAILRHSIVTTEKEMLDKLPPEMRDDYVKKREKRRAMHDAAMKEIIENSKSDKSIWEAAKEKMRMKQEQQEGTPSIKKE
ncbi:hypothetical protein EV175_001024 [Coemansia sp. RSA 1933]|nr:hypothetical protein EV175_001024 [Coemansia sp. RSA 1933]